MVNPFQAILMKVVRWLSPKLVSAIGNDIPFYVAKKTVNVVDGDKVPAQVICPMCQTHWADVVVVLGGPLSPENFVVKELYQHVKIKPDGPLTCPAFGYQFTQWAVMAMVLAAMNKADLDKNSMVSMGPRSEKSSGEIV